MSGCLVTDSVDFKEEENLPPILSDQLDSKYPISSIVSIDRANSEGGEIVFTPQVRDENIMQELQTRYELSSQQEAVSTVGVGPDIYPSGEATRHFDFSIPVTTIIQDHCYRLQLVVTSEFDNHSMIWDKPLKEGDIARAKWWIVEEGADMVEDCAILKYEANETSP